MSPDGRKRFPGYRTIRNLPSYVILASLPPVSESQVLQEHSPSRRVWQFVTEAPALKSLRVISRRWPALVFFLNYDCEDCRLVGLVRVKNGRLSHHRFKY